MKKNIIIGFTENQKELISGFESQLKEIIEISNDLIKEYESLSCTVKKGFFESKTICLPEIERTIKIMALIKTRLTKRLERFSESLLKGSTSKFLSLITSYNITSSVIEDQLNEYQTKSNEYKTQVVIETAAEFNKIQSEFNSELELIKKIVDDSRTTQLNSLSVFSKAAATATTASGGRKTRRRKSKKARKSKRRIKNSRKSI